MSTNTKNLISLPQLSDDLAKDTTLSQAVEFYLATRTVGRASAHTVAKYRGNLTDLMEFLGEDFPVVGMTAKKLWQYFADVFGRGYKPGTLLGYHTQIKTFCRWLVQEELLDKNPMDRVIMPKVEGDRLITIFTEEEIDRILAACGDGYPGDRLFAIVQTFMLTGVRCDELTNMRVDSLGFKARQLRVIGKGDKERPVPLDDLLIPVLEDWLGTRARYLDRLGRPEEQSLFPDNWGGPPSRSSISNQVRRLGKRSGVAARRRVSPHDFRHYFATKLVESGLRLDVVKEILGHTSILTTQKYLHSSGQHIMQEFDRIQAKRRIREGRELFPTKL